MMAKRTKYEKELIKKLDFDIKQIFKLKAAIIKYMCKPVIRNKEELSKEMIMTLIDDLNSLLSIKGLELDAASLPNSTNKSFEEISNEIIKIGYISKWKVTGVLWLQGYVIVRFNPRVTNENIIAFVKVLHELLFVL